MGTGAFYHVNEGVGEDWHKGKTPLKGVEAMSLSPG